MKVLWITNITFPEALSLLGEKLSHKGGGGWMLASAEALIKESSVQLYVVSTSSLVNELTRLQGEGIIYYVMPCCRNIVGYELYMSKLNDEIIPDIVHIHGTELPFGWAWLNVCSSKNVVLSIQGMISVITRYYLAGITAKEIVENITIRDLVRQTLFGEQREFYKRGLREIEVIKKVKHVIGRTSFDFVHCKAINPQIEYHFCNESLRKEFYEGKWCYEKCTPHTIFLSQGAYPLKGLHMVLRALPYVKELYPDVMVRVAGDDLIHYSGIKSILHLSGYGKILRKIIKKYKLDKHLVFTGRLDAEGMRREYLKANLFVCPSSVENSPNSLGEAQLLGTPVVASYAGGIPDMMLEDAENMYQFEEIEMLAEKIIRIFKLNNTINTNKMRTVARQRHDVNANVQELLGIYNKIII